MFSFTDFLGVLGLFLLRFGVPLAVTVGIAYFLKRLDRRWEEEARAEQRVNQPAERIAERPAMPKPAERPATPARTPAPQMPFIIPPASSIRPQAGMLQKQPGLAAQVPQHCWDVKGCSESSKTQCAAPQHPEMPCWQARFGAEGQISEDCVHCDVFQRYPLM
jgi:hypothetical protein